jgi:hypothetical protein
MYQRRRLNNHHMVYKIGIIFGSLTHMLSLAHSTVSLGHPIVYLADISSFYRISTDRSTNML